MQGEVQIRGGREDVVTGDSEAKKPTIDKRGLIFSSLEEVQVN